MSIKNIYTQEAVTLPKDAPLENAVHFMRDIYVSDVIVVEGSEEKARPVGIISDHDIVTKVVGSRGEVDKIAAKDVMDENLVTVNENEDVLECIKILNKNKIQRAPVVDSEGYLKGVISNSDVLVYAQELLKNISEIIKLR